jgi:predicted nucleic acid-binding protein
MPMPMPPMHSTPSTACLQQSAIFDLASQLGPSDLRSLDALHLATALDLADDCHGIVTYDNRLAAAAHSDGSEMLSPS